MAETRPRIFNVYDGKKNAWLARRKPAAKDVWVCQQACRMRLSAIVLLASRPCNDFFNGAHDHIQ